MNHHLNSPYIDSPFPLHHHHYQPRRSSSSSPNGCRCPHLRAVALLWIFMNDSLCTPSRPHKEPNHQKRPPLIGPGLPVQCSTTNSRCLYSLSPSLSSFRPGHPKSRPVHGSDKEGLIYYTPSHLECVIWLARLRRLLFAD